MSQSLKNPTLANFVQKTLGATFLAGANVATLNNVTSIQNLPGVAIVDRVDTNGVETPTKREVFSFTGTSGVTVTGVVKNADVSGTDQDHAVGAIVEFGPDILWAQSVIDGLTQVIVPSTGLVDITKIVDLVTAQILANKTLTTPTIASLVNANHTHQNAAGGGTLAEAALAMTDITTNDVSTTKHGFVPKAPNDTTKFLRGDATYAVPAAAAGLSSKVKLSTYNLATASGDVAYTGIGFQPTSIICLGVVEGQAGSVSWGVADSAKAVSSLGRNNNTFFYKDQSAGTPALVSIDPATGAWSYAIVKTYDVDGFTLTWTRGGTNTGTANLIFLCFK